MFFANKTAGHLVAVSSGYHLCHLRPTDRYAHDKSSLLCARGDRCGKHHRWISRRAVVGFVFPKPMGDLFRLHYDDTGVRDRAFVAAAPWRPLMPDQHAEVYNLLRFGAGIVGHNLATFASKVDPILIGRFWGDLTSAFSQVFLSGAVTSSYRRMNNSVNFNPNPCRLSSKP
jgi:hypothetical protein